MKFSIIIPIYNVAPYLDACLNSVLSQTYSDWEAICVDDGSTDESGRILDEHANVDRRIKAFHRENAGVGAARNYALERATGDRVLFLDSDDVLDKNTLKILADIASKSSVDDIIQFGLRRFNSDEDIEEIDCQNDHKVISERIDLTHYLPLLAYDVYFVQFAYPRSVITDSRFKSYVRGEDLLFMVNCLLRANALYVIREKLYAYRNRPGSAVNSVMSKRILMDQIGYRMDVLRLINASLRVVDENVIGYYCKMMSESCVQRISHDFSGTERIVVWKCWLAAIRELSTLRIVPCYYRFIFSLCSCAPFLWMAKLTCLLPFWIKRNVLR